ncbi:PAS domain S-box-containing protein [Hoeflea marina]|uniref:Blue-light-activated histidine kinase n=1 Tax=Hoeflea marina TaxID=274592 RepID=A0A317PGY7_9HYPH|nr:HWE histidine kinase domain-containing protein [Hoeflea marina]PWV99196.1 PAS domain S-box-containing protein [Hoeflea marina]
MNVPDIVFDPRRLAVLRSYQVLDTLPESGFDDIVQLAAHICATPVALVSLVDGDRQWFKARTGFDGSETDLTRSVCAHSLASPDLLVIPDLALDPRTNANPLVAGEPRIRFYAGAPLVTDDGVALGSLCVIDQVPRPGGLTGQQQTMLRLLARQVMSQLELRRALVERDAILLDKQSAEALEKVTASLYTSLFDAIDAGFCIIEMKFEDGAAVDYRFDEVNPAFAMQTGLHDARGKWMRDLHPGHEQHWFDLYGKVARTGESIRFENPARELGDRWYEVHAFPIITSGGSRKVGILFNDISDRKEIELARRETERVQELVNGELSHRMKNMFAMVQAIATQTLRSVPDKVPVEAFTSRIHALSKAHDVLLHQDWTAAPIGDILKAVLGSLERIDRFELAGDKVILGARATLTVALLLHELTTNAIKYGSLSNDTGSVAVSWRLAGAGDGVELVLNWRESGGPAIGPPTRRGFGSRLIQTGLVGSGGVDLDYDAAGLRAEFRAPLVQVQLS